MNIIPTYGYDSETKILLCNNYYGCLQNFQMCNKKCEIDCTKYVDQINNNDINWAIQNLQSNNISIRIIANYIVKENK